MKKRTIQTKLLIFTAVSILSCTALLSPARAGAADHGFSVKEYEHFHHVLHPLEHEALPKNDFKQIRSKAGDLVTLGQAIVQVGVPSGVEEKNTVAFKEWLDKFGAALVKFKRDADGGTDEQLKQSYTAVHDSFEMLAGMLPKK